MNEVAEDALAEFRKVNVEGTLRLARHAVGAGVQRFIFISSIKVNGEDTLPGRPFTADDCPAPIDAYGVSKYEAEKGLEKIALSSNMEVVIIRPPLVYGPGVKANFLTLLRWLNKDVPLPFGAIHNRRSLVSVANLVDLIVTCLDHPSAANQIFLAGDGEDLSTTELLKRLGFALGKKPRLLPFPSWLLGAVAVMFGKQAVIKRICGSLQVDIGKTHDQLGWIPPVSIDKALRQTADDYLDKQKK
jgi:nucleoside-diphosphate-sugar epimerase